MKSLNDYSLLHYYSNYIMLFYNFINEIAKDNPIFLVLLGILLTLIVTNFENIKSGLRNWYNNIKSI